MLKFYYTTPHLPLAFTLALFLIGASSLRAMLRIKPGLGVLLLTFLLGLFIGGFFMSIPTNLSETKYISGFPFPFAFFEKEGDLWIDYINPYFPIGHLILGVLMAHSVTYVMLRTGAIRIRRSQSESDNRIA